MVAQHLKSQSALTHSAPLFSLSVHHLIFTITHQECIGTSIPIIEFSQMAKPRQTYFLAKYKYYLQIFILFFNVV